MPMQLQFDFRFSRAMKEHLKQMCTTRFSYYTSATSHYPRDKSDLKYSALPKMSLPSTAQQQVQQMRGWRMNYGQCVPQKTMCNMSTKDNPGTLLINLYVQVQLTITPLDFSKIAEDGVVPEKLLIMTRTCSFTPREMLFFLHLTPHLGGQWHTY